MFFRKREYSLFAQSVKIILLIYGLFILAFTAIFLFLNHNMQTNLYDGYFRTIDYCLSGIENDLEIANRSCMSTLYNNPDLAVLACSNDIMTISIRETRLQRTLNSYIQCYSTVDGLFFYSERNDRFISTVRDLNSSSPAWFRDMLRSVDFSDYYQKILTENDSYIFCCIENQYCLVRMFAYNNLIGGVWVNLDTVMGMLEQSTSADALCAFVNLPETDVPVANHFMDTASVKRILEQDGRLVTCADGRYLKFLIPPPLLPGRSADSASLVPSAADSGSALQTAGCFHHCTYTLLSCHLYSVQPPSAHAHP